MTRTSVATLTTALVLTIPALVRAQAPIDFSGKWVYQQRMSRENPAVGFPTELDITQTGTEMNLHGSSNHQDPWTAVYKFDGSPTSFDGPAGVTTAKVAWDGPRLVATTKRSYAGPQGEITVETKEVYSLDNGVLTVDRTQTVDGRSINGKTVYTRSTS